MPEQVLFEEMLGALQKPEVRIRLQERKKQLQADLKTSIGQVAKALNVTEAQLRNWEKQKALVPDRDASAKQGGQRRYGLNDLSKLVLIEELLRQGYSLSDIAGSIQEIYRLFESETVPLSGSSLEPTQSINERIDQADKGYFWRFFVPQVLFFATSLIFESPPTEDAGLFLPASDASQQIQVTKITHAKELRHFGETLACWHGRDRPFYIFFEEYGALLDYPDLYKIISLDELTLSAPATGAYLVTEPKLADALTKPDHLMKETTRLTFQTTQRLLDLLQKTKAEWSPSLRSAIGYMVYLAPDFALPTLLGEPLLSKMAEMVVLAGGIKHDGNPKWRFACILLPDNASASLYQRSLVVRAQSAKSPHQIGTTLTAGPQFPISLSQKAFHSGLIVYRSEVSNEDPAIVSRMAEEPIRSAIAVPIEGEEGSPLGVLYIVSAEPQAFPEEDQRLLRVMGKMIGEVVLTYHARQLAAGTLRRMISTPQIIERTMEEFSSENAFIRQLEGLLDKIRLGEQPLENLSFLAIDIDRHTRIATKFGDWAARNLIWEVGRQIKELFRVHSRKPGDLQLYRVYADRFYVLMNNFSLDETRVFADRLKRSLDHPYRINAAHSLDEEPSDKIVLDDITLRFGVTGYDFERLRFFLQVNPEPVVPSVRAFLTRALDQALATGKNLGGNVIISWDSKKTTFIQWPLADAASVPAE
jgi:DNA-binding transcriptional MerR regulator/GGDEF domain-containing protein